MSYTRLQSLGRISNRDSLITLTEDPVLQATYKPSSMSRSKMSSSSARWSSYTLASDLSESSIEESRPQQVHGEQDHDPYPSMVDSSPSLRRRRRLSNVSLESTSSRSSNLIQQPGEHDIEVGDDKLDHLLACTMEALEASNRLLLDTLDTRAKLAQLQAVESSLLSHMDQHENALRNHVQLVEQMSDFMRYRANQLQSIISSTSSAPTSAHLPYSLLRSHSTTSSSLVGSDLATQPGGNVVGIGIVEAIDSNATIGKTAAKRLEKMLLSSIPASSPLSPSPSPSASVSRKASSVVPSPNRDRLQPSSPLTPRKSSASLTSSPVPSAVGQTSRRTISVSNLDFFRTQDAFDSPSNPSPSSSSAAQRKSNLKLEPSSRSNRQRMKRSISFDSRAQPECLRIGTTERSSSATGFGYRLAASSRSRTSTATPQMVADSVFASATATATVAPIQKSMLLSKLAEVMSEDESIQKAETSQGSFCTRTSPTKASSPLGLAASSRLDAQSTLSALLSPTAILISSCGSSSYTASMAESAESYSPSTPRSVSPLEDASFESKPCDVSRVGGRRISRSKRTSLTGSDRDRQGLIAQLRAEEVVWQGAHRGAVRPNTGGALEALQRLNEMSAASLAAKSLEALASNQVATRSENNEASPPASGWTARRVTLRLGLPSFSYIRSSGSGSLADEPSSERQDPTTTACSDAADTPSETSSRHEACNRPLSMMASLSGWRSWTSLNYN